MNYFTGQGLAYLLTTTVVVILLGVFLLYMVGGQFNDKDNKVVKVDSITNVVGQTQTRNGGK